MRVGPSRFAESAGPPSPEKPATAVPATGMIFPPATLRTTLLPYSAMKRLPLEPTSTPPGFESRADVAARRDLADCAVEVGHVEVAGGVDVQAGGIAELRREGRAAVARVAVDPGSRVAADRPAGGHLADAGVEEVGDVDVAGRVGHHVARLVELRGGGRAAVARVTRRAGAGHAGDPPTGVDPADRVAVEVADVEIAAGEADAGRSDELG